MSVLFWPINAYWFFVEQDYTYTLFSKSLHHSSRFWNAVPFFFSCLQRIQFDLLHSTQASMSFPLHLPILSWLQLVLLGVSLTMQRASSGTDKGVLLMSVAHWEHPLIPNLSHLPYLPWAVHIFQKTQINFSSSPQESSVFLNLSQIRQKLFLTHLTNGL